MCVEMGGAGRLGVRVGEARDGIEEKGFKGPHGAGWRRCVGAWSGLRS